MALEKFRIRGGDDWLLFAERVDAPEDDRAFVAVTECWPVWAEVERRFGDGTMSGGPATSLRNPAVLAIVSAAASDQDFSIPAWSICDECGAPFRFVQSAGIHTHCGCPCIEERIGGRCPAEAAA